MTTVEVMDAAADRNDPDLPDLTPIAAAEAFADCDTREGIVFTWLGEDMEQAIAYGHRIDPVAFQKALREDCDAIGEDDPDDFAAALSEAYYIVTRHAPDCRNGLEPDENCSCGQEWSWWAQLAKKDDPGAIPVTQWSC